MYPVPMPNQCSYEAELHAEGNASPAAFHSQNFGIYVGPHLWAITRPLDALQNLSFIAETWPEHMTNTLSYESSRKKT